MIPNTMLALIEKLAADGRVTAEEALNVRRAVFPDGAVSRGEAEALFALNERIGGDDPAWDACFVEAVSDHLMLSHDLQGHVTDEGAAWLDARIKSQLPLSNARPSLNFCSNCSNGRIPARPASMNWPVHSSRARCCRAKGMKAAIQPRFQGRWGKLNWR